MSSESLRIEVAQQILRLSDDQLLEKILDLLNNETIVGFEADGTPISQKQLLEDVTEVQQQIEAGTLKTYSSDEVRRNIFGK